MPREPGSTSPPRPRRPLTAAGVSDRAPARKLLVGFVVLLLIGWATGEVVKTWTASSDLDAVRDLASGRSPSLIAAAHALSFLGSGYVIFPLALACSLILLGAHRRTAALTIALGTFGAVVIANADKLLVGRQRPPVHHLEIVTSPSFPSGHSAQSTAFFVSLLLAFLVSNASRTARVAVAAAAMLLSLGVACSRVYLGVHYPSDVAGGLLLGAAWALLVARLR